MSDPMTPRTAAGRSLLLRMTTRDTQDLRPAEVIIAAIEAEAVASWLASPEAEEALARALHAACLAGWAEVARRDPDRMVTMHLADAHNARAVLAALRGESDG